MCGVKMKSLTDLANQYKSDKGSEVGAKHNYTPIYEFLFRPYAEKSLKFLEIGLLRGGPELGGSVDRETFAPPSIQMWLDFFQSADVVGFDISDFSKFESQRFKFVRGDSGDTDALQRLVDEHGPFDIVIDDASHASFHQLKAFEVIFPTQPSGGMYIIEDLHWQPKDIEAQLPPCPTGRQFLDWAMGHVSDDDFIVPDELPHLKSLYDEIAFCQGFSGYRTGMRGVKTSVFCKR